MSYNQRFLFKMPENKDHPIEDILARLQNAGAVLYDRLCSRSVIVTSDHPCETTIRNDIDCPPYVDVKLLEDSDDSYWRPDEDGDVLETPYS